MIIINIILTLLIIWLLYYTYKYLKHLESCECAIKYRKEIEILKTQEMFLIILNIFSIFVLVFDKHIINIPLWLGTLLLLFNIGFCTTFIYNVYELYSRMPKNCDKKNKFPRYYLYLQAISFLISIVLICLLGITTILKKGH